MTDRRTDRRTDRMGAAGEKANSPEIAMADGRRNDPAPADPTSAYREPARTVVKLLIASLIAGLFLSFLGLNPVEFWRGAWRLLSGLVSMLGDTAAEIIGSLLTYVLFGAAIVVPVWIALRLLNGRRR